MVPVKTQRFPLLFALMLLTLVPPIPLSAQQKFALVIGNGAYTSISKLNNPENDANDMKAALEDLDFQVDLVLNGSLNQMEDGVIRLGRRLAGAPGSYGFFFYAGHGVQSGGENYLIPVDADIRSESFLRSKALVVQGVLDEIRQAENFLNVVVLDACRDNPFSWRARGGDRGLTVVQVQPAESIIVYATSAGSTASDGDDRNGLFTSHLLSNLKIPGLEVKELFNRVGRDVSRASNNEQRPAIYTQFFDTAYLGSPPAAALPASIPQAASAPRSVIPVQPPPQHSIPENFVRIQGGTFAMGSPASEFGRDHDEVRHQVTVSSFYISQYEVTQAEYQAVMGTNPSKFRGDNLPVENVSWFDAVNYCNERSRREGLTPAYRVDGENVSRNRGAAGFRLPTEAEWEYACLAGANTPFSTGNTITTDQANYNGDPYNNSPKGTYREKPMAVGSFAPNAWGLYDMHGNVGEWCWDWYESYSAGDQTDPVGPPFPSMYRVTRGGSWLNSAQNLRAAYRNNLVPSNRSSFMGFRLVRS
jgi:formylglycine-generating enzyme required for sulfatase activity